VPRDGWDEAADPMTGESVTGLRTGGGVEAARRLEFHSDARLLEIYLGERDAGAFAVLVERHGTRVLRVCRQVLGRTPDAEDAFQATFLLLARKAGAIRKRDSLGPWLHGVAHRLAVRARAQAARRRAAEHRAPLRTAEAPAEADVDIDELRRVLHEEIDRLPEPLRAPILLCYLDGRTNDEAARRLGCPPSTLKERLARGRERLRVRLARRGLALTALLLILLLADRAPADPVPPRLVRATVRAAARRRGWTWNLHGRGGPDSLRLMPVLLTATTLLTLGTALALAAPTPRQWPWLAWLLDAARRMCH
jgi:RNA polymerase sigma factor (sigma-70 family)